MTSLKDVLQLEFAYLEAFTNRFDTSWGTLFLNENQPNYYSSNHAHINEACEHPKLIIDEVIGFYQSKNIRPRYYIYNLEDQRELISELKSSGFGYEEIVCPVQLWNNQIIDIGKNDQITIEIVTEENYHEALEIECSITEFGGKDAVEKVFEEQFANTKFTHYLLRYEGKACSTACIFEHDNQARMESVATIEEFRGKGLIGQVIHFIQQEVKSREINNLWVFPINEKIEKIYNKYGFDTVDKLVMGHAFLGGKSIKEVQG